MNKNLLIYAFFLILAGLTIALPVLAQSELFSDMMDGLEGFNSHAGLPDIGLKNLVGFLIKQALSLLGVLAFFIVMYGGFLWMISGSNEDRKSSAKNVFKNGLIGLIIIILAYSIVTYVFNVFQAAAIE